MNEKILVIEDEEEIRENIHYILELNNYKVIMAENGEAGIKLASEERPDLIICDIIMPKMDGHEVIKKLYEESETKGIPFIFVTAKADIKDIRSGMQLGADDYIVKPFLAKDLIESVKVRLEKFKAIKYSELPEETILQNKSQLGYDDKILLKVNNTPQFINLKDIKIIEADNQYSQLLLTNSKKLLVLKSLKEWEDILPEKEFIRIHRSIILNINYISKIENYLKGTFAIKMEKMEKAYISSRRYSTKIRSRLS